MADDEKKLETEEAKDQKAAPAKEEGSEKKQKPTVSPEWTLYSR